MQWVQLAARLMDVTYNAVPFLTRARGGYMRGTPHGDQQQSVGRRKPRELLIIQTRRHEEEHHDQQNVKMCANVPFGNIPHVYKWTERSQFAR